MLLLLAPVLACVLGAHSALAAEPVDGLAITLGADVDPRAIAARYLDDPDAWPEILRANRLLSADQLRPGMRLRIPMGPSQEAARLLAELRQLIYQATGAGGQVFAPDAIRDAIASEAAAIKARQREGFEAAIPLARQGIQAAREAFAISSGNRDAAAEAVLDSARGTVERRRPNEPDWSAIAVKTLLAEQERLRTLSRSFALVRFRDASSIQVNAGSQLEIRRLRQDRLTRREAVEVVLYGGDIRALLDATASRQTIQVEAPGIRTGTRSSHYWVGKTPESTRLANYEGEIEVASQGGTVVLGANQGTLVKSNEPPLPPLNLLDPPALEQPEDAQVLYGADATLRWSARPQAAAYWLEVARDPRFATLVLTETALRDTQYRLPTGEEGLYYWRLSAVDASGLPGSPSRVRRFQVVRDETPPYLAVRGPAPGYRSSAARVAIVGRTEPDAVLELGGEPIPVDPDGAFRVERPLMLGDNPLVLVARDRAGHQTRVERVAHRLPDEAPPLRIAAPDDEESPRDQARRLLVARPAFDLAGITWPGIAVLVRSADAAGFVASSLADAGGRFRLTLPARTQVARFDLQAGEPFGASRREALEIALDGVPPRIHLDRSPAERTAEATLRLAGWVEGGETLMAGGQSVALAPDGRFALAIPLRPGANEILLRARDRAGNESGWRQTIELDQEPPRLVSYRLLPAEGADLRSLVVEIVAEDGSGVVAAVPYRLAVGDGERRGVAMRRADRASHQDLVVIPVDAGAGGGATPRLRSVTLRDYLGNRQEIDLD